MSKENLKKKKTNEWMKYLEAVLYSIMLIVLVILCLKNNLYINMIPIAVILGAVGQIMLGKRVMTSFFTGILTIVLLQMRNPKVLGYNLMTALKVLVLCLIGELLGWSIKRAFRLFRAGKKKSKKIKKEKIFCVSVAAVSLVVGVLLNGYLNGNIFEYNNAKKSLHYYLGTKYHSVSRFKVVDVRREFSKDTRYVFTTEDVLSNNSTGRFNVYLKDINNVQDDYLESLNKKKIDKLDEQLKDIEKAENSKLYFEMDGNNLINLNIYKETEHVTSEEVEKYANEIYNYIENIRGKENYKDVSKIKIVLKSIQEDNQSIVSEIYMSGYIKMIERKDIEPITYILRALNIEYIDM